MKVTLCDYGSYLTMIISPFAKVKLVTTLLWVLLMDDHEPTIVSCRTTVGRNHEGSVSQSRVAEIEAVAHNHALLADTDSKPVC